VLLSQPQQVFRFEVVIHLPVIKQFCKADIIIISVIFTTSKVCFFSFKVLHDTHFWLQLCIVCSKLPFLCFKHTVSSVSTQVLGSQVFDQDQYDLHYATPSLSSMNQSTAEVIRPLSRFRTFFMAKSSFPRIYPFHAPEADRWIFRCHALQSQSSCRI